MTLQVYHLGHLQKGCDPDEELDRWLLWVVHLDEVAKSLLSMVHIPESPE